MDTNDANNKNTELHHANIVISENDCRDFIFEILEERLKFKTQGNPDFSIIEEASFGIDQARGLSEWSAGKALGNAKVSLVIANSLTLEAQNALLKILEEPAPGTFFFICLPSLGGVLPTFLSRVRVLSAGTGSSEAVGDEAASFLRSDLKGRLKIIRSFSKKEDRLKMLEFLRNLEKAAYDKSKAEAMKNILAAKAFASSRGSSPKMLLEWLACVL